VSTATITTPPTTRRLVAAVLVPLAALALIALLLTAFGAQGGPAPAPAGDTPGHRFATDPRFR
jgi:hypothetical protein